MSKNSVAPAGAGEQRGKWPECQRYESATGEIFNVRLVNKPENKIVYTRSDVDLNGVFTVTLDEWLADLGEQRGLKYQEADNSMHSANFGTHIKEAVAIIKDWAGEQEAQPLPAREWRPVTFAELNQEIKGIVRCVACKQTFPTHSASCKDTRRFETREASQDVVAPDQLVHEIEQHRKELIFENIQLKAELSRLTSRIADLEEARLVDQEIIIAKCQEIAELTSKEEQGGWIERKQQAISVLEWADQGDHEHAMDCVKEALDLLRPTPPDSPKER